MAVEYQSRWERQQMAEKSFFHTSHRPPTSWLYPSSFPSHKKSKYSICATCLGANGDWIYGCQRQRGIRGSEGAVDLSQNLQITQKLFRCKVIITPLPYRRRSTFLTVSGLSFLTVGRKARAAQQKKKKCPNCEIYRSAGRRSVRKKVV